jgi:hypothetical protein
LIRKSLGGRNIGRLHITVTYMREQRIEFSCRCGRRLTAAVRRRASSIRFSDHGRPMENNRCPTPGCGHDYSRLTADELKEHVFSGY